MPICSRGVLGGLIALAGVFACATAWAILPGDDNMALASRGAYAYASSNYGVPYSSPAAAIDGETTGVDWGNGGGWEDATFDSYPDWLIIRLGGGVTINSIVVYTLGDNYRHGTVPGDSDTFALYGLVDFEVQRWNGTGWTTVASVTGNNLVKRTFEFAEPIHTDRIRIFVTKGSYHKSRIVEVQAWGYWNYPTPLSGTVTASSDYGAPLSLPQALFDGDRTGAQWGAGGGWEDRTFDAYPDFVQVNFWRSNTIQRVVVYSLPDNYGRAVEPTETDTFSLYGVQDFTIEGWSGTSWETLATVTDNDRVMRPVILATPYVTDRLRIVVTRALYHKSRIVELEVWGEPASLAFTNVAHQGQGSVVTASSDRGLPISSLAAANDGDFTGASWGNGGGWEDDTFDAYPDWLEVDFNAVWTINRVVVYSLRDDYGHVAAPTETTTFSLYGLEDFTVEGLGPTGWVTLGSVTGNNLVMRTFTFGEFTTRRIRVVVTGAAYHKSRIVEVEAWGTAHPEPTSNVAHASTGAVASASSTYGPGTPVAAVNDGQVSGAEWGSGGGWEDATYDVFPDWVQIDFGAPRSVGSAVVYSLADSYPIVPTDVTPALNYGLRDFSVQGWDGAAWVTLGSITGNTLAKRTLTFPAYTTSRMRVLVTDAAYHKSRIVEFEAWGR